MRVVDAPDPFEYYSEEVCLELYGRKIPVVNLFSDVFTTVDIQFSIDGEFELPIEIQEMMDDIINAKKKHHLDTTGLEVRLFNGDIIRIGSISITAHDPADSEKKTLRITCQYSKYFYTYATNFSLDVLIDDQQTLRDKIAPGPRLPDVHSKYLGNTLGINCMIVSKDGKLLFHKRSSSTANESGIHHSVGGTLKFEHLKSDNHDPVFSSIAANINEETGIEVSVSDLKIIGIARDLLRGGIVDIYALYFSPGNASDFTFTGSEDDWEIENFFWIDLNDLESYILANFDGINSFTLAQIYYVIQYLDTLL